MVGYQCDGTRYAVRANCHSGIRTKPFFTERLASLGFKQFQCQHTQPIYNKAELVKNIFSALYASKLVSYAQGFAVLQRASDAFGWHLDLASIARMWRGDASSAVYSRTILQLPFEATDMPKHLLLAPYFKEEMKTLLPGWKSLVAESMKEELPFLLSPLPSTISIRSLLPICPPTLYRHNAIILVRTLLSVRMSCADSSFTRELDEVRRRYEIGHL